MKKVYKATIWLPIASSAHEGRIVARCNISIDIEATDDKDAERQAATISEGLHIPGRTERVQNGSPRRTWELKQIGIMYPVDE